MRFRPTLASVSVALFILSAPSTVTADSSVIAPGESSTNTEKKDTTSVQTTEQLRVIIEKQDALIKALRARIKELEQASTSTPSPSPSGTPSKQ